MNSHHDLRLTKIGGMSFDIWSYILILESKAHGNPMGTIEAEEYRDFYDENLTPHDALEESFNDGC